MNAKAGSSQKGQKVAGGKKSSEVKLQSALGPKATESQDIEDARVTHPGPKIRKPVKFLVLFSKLR